MRGVEISVDRRSESSEDAGPLIGPLGGGPIGFKPMPASSFLIDSNAVNILGAQIHQFGLDSGITQANSALRAVSDFAQVGRLIGSTPNLIGLPDSMNVVDMLPKFNERLTLVNPSFAAIKSMYSAIPIPFPVTASFLKSFGSPGLGADFASSLPTLPSLYLAPPSESLTGLIKSIADYPAIELSLSELMKSAKAGPFGFDYQSFRSGIANFQASLEKDTTGAETMLEAAKPVLNESERAAYSPEIFQEALGLSRASNAAGHAVALVMALSAGTVSYVLDAGMNGDLSPVSSVMITGAIYMGVRKIWVGK